MSTNVSNDKNASVQHRTKQETQLHCFGYVMYIHIWKPSAAHNFGESPG